jgi:universal stress protein E
MARPECILVIVDPTAQEHPCVEKAERLARVLGARIELYVCDTKAAREARLLAPSGAASLDLGLMLEGLAEPLRRSGLDVCTSVEVAERLADGLIDRTRRTCADLVLKDTHHHSVLKRTLFTNTDWQLIRACPVPLLLTKNTTWQAHPTIVGAVDPGHLNDKPAALDHRILEWAALLARHLDGALHAVHAYIPLTVAATAANVGAPMANTLTPEVFAEEEKHKRAELRALTEQYGLPPEHTHLELGVASEVLPRQAERLAADIVVMGAIARSGLERLFIGSTAERVLERLPCDVLVVKPVNFKEILSW